MNIKVLVTGASGQLGKTIQELYSKNKKGNDFTFVPKEALDITNKKDLKSFFNNNAFDYCINCAAYTNVEEAEKAPQVAYQINGEGVKNLAQFCCENNTILIHISTDYVFDGKKNQPYTVDDETSPINEYGKSKLLGEQYIQESMRRFFIVRTSWLYSKKYGNNFYRTILEKANTEKQLFISSTQIGCPTDTVNLSNYILKLIIERNSSFGIHHFCDNKVMTWYNFAEQILIDNNMKNNINLVRSDKYITFAKRPKYSVLRNSNS
jgi:dTDP-4-dehydrorhamnose reductase